MEHETAQGVAHKRPIYRSDTVGDGEHGPHERADEHGAHDGDVGVGVQANARNDHCDDEDAQMGARKTGTVDEALADHMVGRAPFADIEGAANEFLHAPPDALQRRAIAVAPPMPVDVLLPHVVVVTQGAHLLLWLESILWSRGNSISKVLGVERRSQSDAKLMDKM